MHFFQISYTKYVIDFKDKKIPKCIISKSTVYMIILFWKLCIFQNTYRSIRLGCWLACKWKERLGNTAVVYEMPFERHIKPTREYQFSVTFDSTIRTYRALERNSRVTMVG